MGLREKVLKKINCFMFNVEERHDIDIYTILKNLELIFIDLITSIEALPGFQVESPDLESISYHSRSIELIVAKLDDSSYNKDIIIWKTVYDNLIDIFNAKLSIREDSIEEEKLLNVCDIIATLYTKFSILIQESEDEMHLFWTIKYGYETDWGEDMEYVLEILPGIRELIAENS